MWLVIALIGYLLLALVFVLDKIILTKSVGKPIVYTFYSTIYMVAAFATLLFGGGLLHGMDWWWAILSGVSFGFGLWTMFIAVQKSEASHINPFIGGVITIFVLLLSLVFLGERLGIKEIIGVIILACASLLLSSEKSKHNSGIHMGFLWGIISAICFAVSHVTAKYLYDIYSFATAFGWTKGTVALVGLFTLLFPSVRALFKTKKKKATKKAVSARTQGTVLIIVDKIAAASGVVLIQYAAAIGSVSVVHAMSGIQYVIMFLFILMLTRFWPRILKEYMTKRELIIQTIAFVLVVLGSAFFVI